MRITLALALAAGIVASGIVQPADAKKWTVYDRQITLGARIERAEQAKELTFKEASDLREDLSDIQRDKGKMMLKNNGRLSYEDEHKLEERLNKVSTEIHRKKLEKRVVD